MPQGQGTSIESRAAATLAALVLLLGQTPECQGLDLDSTESALESSHSAVINVGGVEKTISPGDAVTAAELAAIYQVANTGQQSIVLSTEGTAVGGSLNIHELPLGQNLVIPAGVTAIYDGAVGANLSISGNLVNAGNLYAVSSASHVTQVNIGASNITNDTSGLITSILPSTGLPGFSNLVQNLNLSLMAVQNITNYGSITSGGSLELSAGGAIANLANSALGTTPVVQAQNNLNLLAGAGINNTGILSSIAGNLNISSTISALDVTNLSGRMEALNGALNVRDSGFSAKGNTNILGGSLLSNEVNIFAGTGVVNMNVENVLGTVNAFGGEAHFDVQSGLLKLGAIEMVGDPTFYNRTGSVEIASNLVFSGAPLAIVAAQDIITTPGAGIISTSSGSGNAGSILLVAGAAFDSFGPCCVPTTGPPDTNNLTILGPSATGGKIDLATGALLTQLNASSTAGSGGNVTLVAYAGSSTGSGTILLAPTSSVTAGGSGANANGNVTMIAGAANGTAITAGSIVSNTGTGGGGNITLSTSVPSITGGSTACAPCVTLNNGAITSGAFISSPTNTAANISVNNIEALQSAVDIRSGGTFYSNGAINNSGGSIGIAVNSATAFSLGAVSTNGVNGDISTARLSPGTGGTVSIVNSGTGDISFAGPTNINVSTPSGNGGAILLQTSGAVNLPAGAIMANGAVNGNGGTITISAAAINADAGANSELQANGAGTGNGGTVTIQSTGALTIGVDPGKISLSATGGSALSAAGDGGTVTVGSTGLTQIDPAGIDVSPIGDDGKGGTINVGTSTHAGVVRINSTLDASGVGTGGGGAIKIYAQSNNLFNVGDGAVHGISGSLTANAGALGGAGGTVLLSNRDPGGVAASGGISISTGTITVDTTAGRGGTIRLGSHSDPRDATIVLPGTGSVLIASNQLNTNAAGGSFDGGAISIYGLALTVPATGIDLQANADGAGSGGSIVIRLTGVSPVVVGNTGIRTSATGGSAGSLAGNGGELYVRTASSITMDSALASNFSIAPLGTNGNGGRLYLDGSELKISGNLNMDGVNDGDGGSVSLLSDSAFGFNFGDATTNGVSGILSARAGASSGSGGLIFIKNIGGAIGTAAVQIAPNTAVLSGLVAATRGHGGSLGFEASGQVFLPGGVVALNGVGPGDFNGGNAILRTALGFGGVSIVGGGTLQFDVLSSGNGNGGSVEVPAMVAPVPGGIVINAYSLGTGDGGRVLINTPGLVDMTAVNIESLGANANGGQFRVDTALAGNLVITGDVNVSGKGTGNGGLISIRTNSANAFNVGGGAPHGTTGDLIASGVNGGTIAVINSAAGGITINGILDAAATAGNGGQISLVSDIGTLSIQGGSLSVDGTAGGNGGRVGLDASTITVLGGVPLQISANGNAGLVFVKSTGLAPLTIGPADIAITATGASTQVDLRAGGDLIVDMTALLVNAPAGSDGPSLSFTAGAGADVLITGSIDVSASGAGNAGSVSIGNGSASMSIGSNTGASFVTGSISADASGTGRPGSIAIESKSGVNYTINLDSSVSASSASSFGEFQVIGLGAPLTISGTGQIEANLSIQSSAATVTLTSPNTSLRINGIAATGGDVSISVAAAGSSVTVLRPNSSTGITGSISSLGDIDITAPTLNNFGRIVSTGPAGSTLTISSNADLTIGNGGIFQLTAAGSTMSLIAQGALTLQGSNSFDAGLNGNLVIQALGGGITFNSCELQTLRSDANLTLDGSTLNLSANTVLATGGTITITGSAINVGDAVLLTGSSISIGALASPLTITLADASTATFTASTGAIVLNSNDLTFAKQAGAAGSQLNLVSVNPLSLSVAGGIGADIEVQAGLTVSSNRNITASLDGGTFNNAGTLTSSAAAAQIDLLSSAALTVAGNGLVSATSVGANVINVSAVNNLVFTGNQRFDPGAAGSVNFSSGTAVVISSAPGPTVLTDAPLTVTTPVLQFTVNGAGLAGGPASTISIVAPANNSLTVMAPSSGSASLGNGTGVVSFSPDAGQDLIFGLTAGGTGTLNVSGGGFALGSSARVEVDTGATLIFNNPMTIDAGTTGFVNNGTIRSTVGGVSLIISSNGALPISGTGVIEQNGGGATQFSATGVGGAITFAAGANQTFTGGGAISILSPIVNFNGAATLNIGSSVLSIGPGAAQPLVVSLTGGSVVGVNTTGGSFTISGGIQPVTFNSVGAGTGTLSVAGAPLTASSAAALTVNPNVRLQSDSNVALNGGSIAFGLGSSLQAGLDVNATSAAALTTADSVLLNAGRNLNLLGTAITFGNTNSITAGTLPVGDPTSTVMSDYTFAAFTVPGTVRVTTTTGDLNVGAGNVFQSLGGSVWLVAQNDINVGSNNTFRSQGGDIILNAGNFVSIPAASVNNQFISVGRNTPGTIVVDNNTIQNYSGGGIAIWGGGINPVLDTYLRTLALARVSSSSVNISPVANLTGTTVNLANGSYFEALGGLNKIGVVNNLINLNGAVLSLDPPGDQIDVNNAVFLSIAGALTPPVPLSPGAIAVGAALNGFSSGIDGAVLVALPANIRAANEPEFAPNGSTIPTDITPPEGVARTALEDDRNCQPPFKLDPKTRESELKEGIDRSCIAAGSCQPFYLETKDGLVIVGSNGATVSAGPDEHSLELKEGRLIVVATEVAGCTISTEFGAINLPGKSAVVVEQSARPGEMTVISIAGNKIGVQLTEQSGTALSVGIGEQLHVRHRSTKWDDRAKSGIEIKQESVNIAKVLNQKDSFFCSQKCTAGAAKKGTKDLRQLINLTFGNVDGVPPVSAEPADEQNLPTITLGDAERTWLSDGDLLTPVKFSHPGNNSKGASMHSWQTDAAEFRYHDDASFFVNEKSEVFLKDGEMIFSAIQRMSVKTPETSVAVSPNTIVHIVRNESITRVRTLYEKTAASTYVSTGTKSMEVAAGEELVIGTKGIIRAAVLDDAMGRRNVQRVDIGSNTAVHSEVSFVALIQTSRLLREIVNGKAKADMELASRMFKMHLCLQYVTAKRGPYLLVKYQQP